MTRLADTISLADFRADVERETLRADYPGAMKVEKNIPIYDARTVTPAIAPEWARIIGDGPGVFVVKNAFTDTSAIDAASDVFRAIIADERAAGTAAGDHFAKAGANDRIWNSLQKLCLRAPDVYARYMANPVIDLACRAWLGPGYQLATQVNQVRPGGKAQAPHRDYH
ncbi:MAG: phytanoyl-CoA dioxygenase family protein, partial [Cypionkella sp.]|uniref:phytanoyl-CoA dioxygenase family protein n=1 Tax=Cypionkella sp. TaxID=2811411 RepID=UPI00262F10C0